MPSAFCLTTEVGSSSKISENMVKSLFSHPPKIQVKKPAVGSWPTAGLSKSHKEEFTDLHKSWIHRKNIIDVQMEGIQLPMVLSPRIHAQGKEDILDSFLIGIADCFLLQQCRNPRQS